MDFAMSNIVRTEYVLARPTDDDLRDEVAKAVLPEMARQQNNWRSGVVLAYEWADAFMAERTRRREGR